MLHKEGFKFECMLVGNESDKLSKMAEEKGLLNSSVFIMPAVSYATVGSMMRAADALVLFSRFENMPCVVLEALCAGLPVVSTNVGGIHEVVDASNGILLPEGDVEALANAMKKIMQQRNNYNSHNISESARAKFGYDTIGKEISDIYKKISVSSD
jgi:glycosyltransferase involved in cell wall biosynthesis